MKTKFSLLTLVFLVSFSINASADDLNITGVYENPYACGDRSFEVSVRIVHQLDNPLEWFFRLKCNFARDLFTAPPCSANAAFSSAIPG